MRAFAKPGLWIGIWVFGWLLCVLLSMITPPDISLGVDNSDKIGHFLAYGILSAWAVMIFQNKRSWALSAIGLVFLGITMELAQGYLTSTRMMDWHDAIANTMGVVLGLCTRFFPMQGWLQRLDKKLFS